MTPPDAYVVLSTQRTGSHLLGEVLGSHPAFAQAGEVLIPETTKRGSFDSFLAARPGDTTPPEVLWREYISHLRQANPSASHVGFLVKYGHASRFAGLSVVESPELADTRIVHLVRRNLLRVVASHQLAITRRVHVTKEHKTYDVDSVTLDPSATLVAIRSRAKTVAEHRTKLERRDRVLELAYEDIMDGGEVRQATIDSLCSFFAVDDRFTRAPQTVKLAPPQLAQLIDNYDDVARALRGTDYEHMLD